MIEFQNRHAHKFTFANSALGWISKTKSIWWYYVFFSSVAVEKSDRNFRRRVWKSGPVSDENVYKSFVHD